MDDLINEVSQKTGLSADKARTVVDTVVNYIESKLPASVAGQIDAALKGQGSSISEKLGGIFGRKSA